MFIVEIVELIDDRVERRNLWTFWRSFGGCRRLDLADPARPAANPSRPALVQISLPLAICTYDGKWPFRRCSFGAKELN